MLDYYELGEYVFTHGWLPLTWVNGKPRIHPSWKNASEDEWREARLLEWQQTYSAGLLLSGRTVVCGHRPASLGSMFDSEREPDCSLPFFADGMIALDAGTVRSGRVNVLVIEERASRLKYSIS